MPEIKRPSLQTAKARLAELTELFAKVEREGQVVTEADLSATGVDQEVETEPTGPSVDKRLNLIELDIQNIRKELHGLGQAISDLSGKLGSKVLFPRDKLKGKDDWMS